MSIARTVWLFLIALLAVLVIQPVSGSEFSIAPQNPLFQQQSADLGIASGDPGSGILPGPLDLSHIRQTSFALPPPFPARYDLRTKGKVTPVKNQVGVANSWAFAAYGSLESTLLPGETWDFSENHMKNTLSRNYSWGFDRDSNGVGWDVLAVTYLARWSGPVNERDDPYSYCSTSSPALLPVQKHLREWIIIPPRTSAGDNNGFKHAIMAYGGATTSVYFTNTSYNPATAAYYFSGTGWPYINAIVLVGWDDNYLAGNFATRPPGDGAFIARNSFSSGWGDGGYFYISYYDTSLARYYDWNAVYLAESPDDFDNIYQYDPLGWVSSVGTGTTDTCYAANIFPIRFRELLSGIGFYTPQAGSSYRVLVYKNPDQGPISSHGPVAQQSGTLPNAGYHVITLDTPVTFRRGDTCSVAIQVTSPGYHYPIAFERAIKDYSSHATGSGRSWVSTDGKTWQTFADALEDNTADACIKAFTVNLGPGPTPTPTQTPTPTPTPTPTRTPVPGTLKAQFSANRTTGDYPLTVAFYDRSVGNPDSWNWTFGDGTTSPQQNPVHTYFQKGTFTVSLTVTKKDSARYMTIKPDYITVKYLGGVGEGFTPF